MKRLFVFLLLCCVSSKGQGPQGSWKACFVLSPNGEMSKTDAPDTQRIQEALNLCNPGMAVVLRGNGRAKNFHSAPLIVPRGVTLLLDKSKLIATRDAHAYDIAGRTCQPGNEEGKTRSCKPFIFSYQAPYSGVAGDGTIDGQGCAVVVSDYESQGFHISGVTIRNARRALIRIEKTIDLAISDVTLNSDDAVAGKSNGIVLTNVVNARITSTFIQVPGRIVAVEPSPLGPTAHIHLRDVWSFGSSGPPTAPRIEGADDITQESGSDHVHPVRPQFVIDTTAVLQFGNKRNMVVAHDGSGDFRTVQQAIDALPAEGGDVLIKPGTYREVVTLRKPHVHLHGDSSGDPAKTVVVFNNAGPTHGGTFNSSTFFVEADDATLDHFTVANDAGPHAGQAVALSVNADRAIFRSMRFLGAQDTLYAASRHCYSDYGPCIPARQYFSDSYIEGGVDFIFGDAKALFERCELHAIPTGNVMYTAQSRHTPDQDSGYIFKNCRLTGEKRLPGTIALGRAWRPYATVVYLNAEIDAPVIPAGWVDWPRFGVSTLPTAFFAEYNSTGPGASPTTREPYSHQLTSPEAARWASPAFLAGSDGWNPPQR